jgi:hypothetical protein
MLYTYRTLKNHILEIKKKLKKSTNLFSQEFWIQKSPKANRYTEFRNLGTLRIQYGLAQESLWCQKSREAGSGINIVIPLKPQKISC